MMICSQLLWHSKCIFYFEFYLSNLTLDCQGFFHKIFGGGDLLLVPIGDGVRWGRLASGMESDEGALGKIVL